MMDKTADRNKFVAFSCLHQHGALGVESTSTFCASIWGGFFEFLKHAKQDLGIIEFEDHSSIPDVDLLP